MPDTRIFAWSNYNATEIRPYLCAWIVRQMIFRRRGAQIGFLNETECSVNYATQNTSFTTKKKSLA